MCINGTMLGKLHTIVVKLSSIHFILEGNRRRCGGLHEYSVFILTCCPSFLSISYSLHSPPRRSLCSFSQADETTVRSRMQKKKQDDMNFRYGDFFTIAEGNLQLT